VEPHNWLMRSPWRLLFFRPHPHNFPRRNGLNSAKTPSYALLLIPIGQPDAGYRFLVFSRNTGQSFYQATVVEHSDDHGASNYFIRRVSIGKFFDEESKRKFQVQATDGIVMTDSAENEYGADVYFWSNGSYRHEPIDD